MTGRQNNPTPSKLANYGCTVEFWREMRDLGLKMIAEGTHPECTPLRAFSHQRSVATKKRGLGWELTLPQWWAIWSESGHWHERGVGRGYMMCRKGDTGPYAVGNVFIGPGQVNLSDASRKHPLPIGVSYARKSSINPYRAVCWVDGKQRHLGCFPTPETAHAAYLAAVQVDVELRRAA